MLVLTLQLIMLSGSGNTGKYITNIYTTAAALEKKDNILQIEAHLNLLKQIQTDHYWETINVKKLEELYPNATFEEAVVGKNAISVKIGDQEEMKQFITKPYYAYLWALNIGDREYMKVVIAEYTKDNKQKYLNK